MSKQSSDFSLIARRAELNCMQAGPRFQLLCYIFTVTICFRFAIDHIAWFRGRDGPSDDARMHATGSRGERERERERERDYAHDEAASSFLELNESQTRPTNYGSSIKQISCQPLINTCIASIIWSTCFHFRTIYYMLWKKTFFISKEK
jgi:hypothetical protein